MFSRWISKVKTSLSPKAWLAKHVAATLNDVFILDAQEDIESNLLTDTKIVLKHARQQKSSYIQRQIQQIVDHLTLDIADFTLLIQDHGCHSDNSLIGDIRVQAKSLQLLSFGRQQQQQHQEHDTSDTTDTDTDADTPTPPLSQRISLEAIKIDVLLQEQELPLLKPIGYAASVKRITGRRFLDGWRNGLQVVGESPDALVLHAGGVQLKTLCRLLKPLAAYDTAATVTPTNQEEEEDEGASTTITPTTITLPLPSVALILPEGTAVRIPQCTLLYHMDGSTSQLVGSEGVWIGDQPFLNFADTKTKDDSNGAHQENTKWKLDFVQRVVSLHQSSAFVEWNDTVVKQLVRECQQLKASVPQDIMEQVESTIYEYEETAVKTVLATTGDETNTTWRFESGTRASLGVRIRSDRGWAQASLESPALTITMNQKGALEKVQFEMGGAQFGPTSFGTKKSSIIRLPRLAFAHSLTPTSDLETIRIQECIDATIESQTVLSELQALGSDLLKFPGLQPEDGAKSSTASKASIGEATVADSLPPIAIAKVKLTLEAEGAKAQFGGVSVRFLSNGTTISSESLVCHILDRTAGECPEVEVLSVQNVAVQLGLSPSQAHLVTMQRLNRVHVPGLVDRMVVPLEKVRLKYNSAQSMVQLDVPSLLHLALSPTVLSKGDTEAPAPPSSMQLPVSVQARFAKVQLSRGRVSMCIQPLQLSITSHGNGNAMTASLWGNGCTVRVQVDDQNSAENRWLEASVASNSKVALSSMCEVEALECTGAHILGTSCGQLDVSIPPLSYSIVEGQPRVQANGELTVLLQSGSVAKKVQSLLEEAVCLGTEKECVVASDDTGLSSIPPLPPVTIAKVKLTLQEECAKVQFVGVSVRFPPHGTTISSEALVCHVLEVEGPEVEVLSAQHVAVQLGLSPGHAHLVTMQWLNRVHVPGLVDRMVVPLENVRLKYNSAQSKVQLDVPSLLHLALSPTVPSKGDTWAPAPPSSMQLPVSVQARFAKVQLSRGRASLCIQPLQLSITSHGNGNAMTASLWGNGCTVRVQVDDQNSVESRWLEASVASNSKVTLSSMCEVEALECTGARILGTSCGQLDVSIPPLSYSIVDGQPRVQANGELTILLQSDSVAKEVQSLLEEAIGLDSEKECAAPSDEAGLSSIPPLWKQIEMVLPQAKAVVKEPMHLEGHAQNVCLRFNDARASTITVSIDGHAASYGPFSLRSTDASVTVAPGFHKATVFFGGASLSGPSGIALIMSDMRAELESPATAIVTGLVDSFVVPSMFELEEPTAGGTFSFTDGLIDITLAKLCGICPKLLGANTATSKADDDTTGALLACPIHVRVQELSLKATKESTASIVGASPVDILVVPAEGLMSVDADLGTNLRIVDSANGRWLQASISPISAVLEPSGMPSNASCSLIRIGPCSPGQLGISIPKFEMVSTAIKTDEVTGSFESFDVLQEVQALWHDCFPSESTSSPPFIWSIPKAIVSVESMKTRVVAEHVTFDSAMTGLSCSRLGWQDDGGVAAAFSGLHVEKKTVTGYHGVIATIDALYFPAFGTIGRPVQQKTMVSFDDDGLSIETPPVDVVIFEGEQQKVGQDLAPKSSAAGTIPFPVRLNLQRVNIRSFSENGEVTVLSQLAVHLRPQEQDPFAQNATQGAFFHLALTSAENKLLKLAKTTASGVVFPSDLATIHQFRLATGAAEVSVGLSSVDWASVFGNQKSQDAKKPIALPLCLVENFVAHLKYQGTIVGMQQTSVNVPALQGGPNTSSSDLVQHLKKAMLDRVPAMITNAAFLGENVSEMTAKTAGRVLLAASTATGSAAGSVVGLAAIDGIRGSVTAGKESRGAQTGEGYKFGDFSRGAIHSIRQAATSGAQTRRGESESYSVGDFTVGASKGAVKYASQNKSRLGAAGGSGAGMIIGAAVAGPLGLVAGSIIGSKFGGAALGDSQTTEQSSPAESSASLGQPTATSNEVDLLGLPVSHQSQTTRTVVSPSMPMPHRPGVNPNFGSAGMANAPPSTTYQQAPVQHQPQQRQEQQKKGYRFGDFAKGVVAKGKEKSGRSGGDAYKFGDFSRGLFK
ncbi:expressed unknown protein [Seminavis robusta]|uniref:Uncharacterized protein n=1 Tax=Seminavis robusta TaxID=568900 RepID=A0A9N8H1W1_9STRA|nr:expressed unknown protein [Seminavis robusta]|eukprot:Sro9_g007030.1 n/a (2071) ;mRNA; r:19453-26046